jgi:bla regulator protein BlaR1
MTSIIVRALIVASGSQPASILIKVTLTTAIALAVVKLASGCRAAVRHVMLGSAFAILLALPITSLFFPAIHIAIPSGPAPAPSSIVPVSGNEASTSAIPEKRAEYAAASKGATPSLDALLIAGWAAGAMILMLSVFAGLCQIRALRRSALRWRNGQDIVDQARRSIGLGRRIEVLLHGSLRSPMTCGVFRAAILFPSDATTWTDEDLRRAAVHELEHVRRFDCAAQCIARIVSALYWFHPLVWIALRRFLLEAERACDDAVLAYAEPVAYADQLVSLAQRLSAAASSHLVGMANGKDLTARISAVLDGGRPRGKAGSSWVLINVAVCLLLSGTVSRLQFVSEGAQVNTANAFEVASVKLSQPSGRGTTRQVGGCRGSDAAVGKPSRANIPLGRCVFRTARLSEILSDMYNLPSNRISGVPDWDRSSFFDVEGKAEDPSTTGAQLIQMLQRLLAERFHLTMRHTAAEAPIFAMRLGKNGHKMQPSSNDSALPSPQGGSLVFKGYTMSKLAEFLSGMPSVGRPVQDMTQLSGRFDFSLAVLDTKPDSPEEMKSAILKWDSILSDVQEQLGLHFDSEKGMVDAIIIDHAEKPSEN